MAPTLVEGLYQDGLCRLAKGRWQILPFCLQKGEPRLAYKEGSTDLSCLQAQIRNGAASGLDECERFSCQVAGRVGWVRRKKTGPTEAQAANGKQHYK